MKVRVCPNCGEHNPADTWSCSNKSCGATLPLSSITDLENATVETDDDSKITQTSKVNLGSEWVSTSEQKQERKFITCPKCGHVNKNTNRLCEYCQVNLIQALEDYSREIHIERRFGAIRIISTLFKILGTIVLIFSLLFAVSICASGVQLGSQASSLLSDLSQSQNNDLGFLGPMISIAGLITGFIPALFGASIALILFAVGEGIEVLLEFEENTRLTSNLIEQRFCGKGL